MASGKTGQQDMKGGSQGSSLLPVSLYEGEENLTSPSTERRELREVTTFKGFHLPHAFCFETESKH